MSESIPKMDQIILNKYFPGQVAKKHDVSTPSLRAYIFEGNKGIIITTKRFKESLAKVGALMALQSKWNISINKEGNHLACLLTP